MLNLTKEQITKWLELEENDFHIDKFRQKHEISPESSTLYVTLGRLVEEKKLKRVSRGWYRKVKELRAIEWWEYDQEEALPIVWPYGADDNSSFEFDQNIEVMKGDLIVIAGVSNMGKTCFALNFLVNNLSILDGHARLMGNEYKPVRFAFRIKRMAEAYNAQIWNSDKQPRFDLLPVTQNHADYIVRDKLNIVDWINIRGEFYAIGGTLEDIQAEVGNGLALIVLQKSRGKSMGMGGDFGAFTPSVYMTIDPLGKGAARLNVLKVKSTPPEGMRPEGKMYGFSIVDRGSKFHNIREIKTCPACRTSGYVHGDYCDKCQGLGYVDVPPSSEF